MQLALRDRHMLQWINGHGFVTVEQACAWMRVNYSTGQTRMKKLTEAGLLKRKRFEVGQPRVNWLTKKGAEASGDDLAPPKRINRVTYFHDRVLVDIALNVVAQTGGVFWPQRRLKADKISRQCGGWPEGHTPNGLLYVEGKKPIAVELEMSVKEHRRLADVIAGYAADKDLEDVWFFVTKNEIRRLIERVTDAYSGFQIITWKAAA